MEEAASSLGAKRKTIPRKEAEVADNHMAITETEISLKADTNGNHTLLYMENLTLPSFQVVVMAANMQCNGCRARVSRVLSKMTGLTEYTVDVRKKEVTVKGDFIAQCNLQDENLSTLKRAKSPSKSLLTCLTHSDDI